MAQLKRWESPRKTGRNDKGRGGSARQRQLRKRTQALRQQLKSSAHHNPQKREVIDLSFFVLTLTSPQDALVEIGCVVPRKLGRHDS